MRIALFTDTFVPEVNGVARTLKRLADFFEKKEIEYKIFVPEIPNNHSLDFHIHRFTSFRFFLYPECRVAFPNMMQMKAELQAFQPHLIHIATPFNIGLCGLHYAKKMQIPVVGSYHTDFDHYLRYYDLRLFSKLLWRYMHWFYRPLQKIFVPSHDTMERLKRRGFTNLHMWPRGVDGSLFHPDYDKEEVRNRYNIHETYLLVYVGRIAAEKDVHLLPQIAAKLPEPLRNQVHWLIVGDGPLKESLQQNAPDRMTFAGYLHGTELAKVYAAADLFVFPSPTETFGNVVLESLASGTPVIGADSGGVKNIVQHGIFGCLCEPGDVDGFVEAIVRLLANDAQRKQMGAAGRAYALTQNWDTILEELLSEYEKVLHCDSHSLHA
ncbi:glycosyltransferase family 4 protein [Anoxybacteroides tepidamans]|uniref:glycosyltransferase family 4 protein n=1 Tax=Anoxybacteroides tepidamans TaxID=265948 RepID=UPI000481DF89|nr:glycosyltransferase family 1 protein [Anoxybacillus tepidamans]